MLQHQHKGLLDTEQQQQEELPDAQQQQHEEEPLLRLFRGMRFLKKKKRVTDNSDGLRIRRKERGYPEYLPWKEQAFLPLPQ